MVRPGGHPLLASLARLVTQRALAVALVGLAVTAAAAVVSSRGLQINADTDELMGRDQPSYEAFRRFREDFGDLRYLYVIVEVENDLGRAKRFADELTRRLRELPPDEVHEVLATYDTSALEADFGLLYAKREDLVALPGLIRTAMTVGSPAALLDAGTRGVTVIGQRSTVQAALTAVGLLDAASRLLPAALTPDLPPVSPTLGERYLVSQSGRALLVQIMPAKDYRTTAIGGAPLRHIRDVLAGTRHDFPEVRAGLTGKLALQADELSTASRDSTRAGAIAFVLVGLALLIGFRSFSGPILAMVSLFCGLTWTFAFATLVFGELNLLSIVFVPIVVGNGVDFAIHVLARYGETAATAETPEDAVSAALHGVGESAVVAGGVVAAAFYSAAFTGFHGLAQLGIIAGTGILLCLLSALTVFPALLVLRDRHLRGGLHAVRPPVAIPLVRGVTSHPGRVAAVVLVPSLALAFLALRVRFDTNMLNLQAENTDSVYWERQLLALADDATWFAASIAHDLDDLRARDARTSALPSVARTDSVLRLLPAQVELKLPYLEAIRSALAEGARADTVASGDLPPALGAAAHALRDLALRFHAQMKPDQAAFVIALADRLAAAQAGLASLDAAERQRMAQRTTDGLDELKRRLSDLHVPSRAPGISDLPEPLRRRYVSPSGALLLYALPRANLWEEGEMARFVGELRSVDADVTGDPVTFYDSLLRMKRAFRTAAVYALLVNVAFTLLMFRSVGRSLLTLVPLAFGGLWTLEAMGALGIDWNLANFFALPILIGLAVDNGVHVVDHVRQAGGVSRLAPTALSGVVLSSLNNAIGFGSLLVASHRGMRSLGIVLAVGALACLAAAIVLLPALLAMREPRAQGSRSG